MFIRQLSGTTEDALKQTELWRSVGQYGIGKDDAVGQSVVFCYSDDAAAVAGDLGFETRRRSSDLDMHLATLAYATEEFDKVVFTEWNVLQLVPLHEDTVAHMSFKNTMLACLKDEDTALSELIYAERGQEIDDMVEQYPDQRFVDSIVAYDKTQTRGWRGIESWIERRQPWHIVNTNTCMTDDWYDRHVCAMFWCERS